MIQVDVRALTQIVYLRLKTAAEGAPVRSLLGAGANSLLPAEDLNTAALPQRPFGALRFRTIARRDGDAGLHIATYIWWWYDDPARGQYRLSPLPATVSTAYAARVLDSPPGGAIGPRSVVIGPAGEARPDPALAGLIALPLPLTIYL